MKVEQLTGPVAYHGEGPIWWEEAGGLCWMDMLAGDVLRMNGVALDRWHVGQIAAALRPRVGGGAIVAREHDVVLVDEFGGESTVLAELLTDAGLRLNEGGCDPEGRFLVGSMAYDQRPGAGSLFRVEADGRTTTVIDGLTLSNGLDWDVDRGRAYFVDTMSGRLDLVDLGPEGSGERQVFVTNESAGCFDGLTVDAEGGIWVAVNKAGAVHRYHPDGELTQVIELPCQQVTACTFGGADLAQLFITTSRELEVDPHPTAGALFCASPGVSGRPPLRFAG